MSEKKYRKGQITMTEISYTKKGDYLLPNLTLSEQPAVIGKYGRMRKAYLQEHRPGLYNRLILSEQLWEHLRETEQSAQERLEQIENSMKQQYQVTETLKASDPMKWVGLMNSIHQAAEETILNELVYN